VLPAALSAAEQGARVLVLQKAAKEGGGGNSTFTAGGFRFCHDGVEASRTDILDDMAPANTIRSATCRRSPKSSSTRS
jgi:tricarballylate dehydrogenase